MEDPVIDPEGNSYEKHAIEQWVRANGRSPITRTSLLIDDLRPNRALKMAIDEYRHSVQSDIESDPVPIRVHTSEITAKGIYADDLIHISLIPPQEETRSPCDICCVVDTSGSMSDRAEIQNDKNEQYGLSQLDLVKHALKTIVQSLQIQDRLAIVSFSDHAKVVYQLTKMDQLGRTNALTAIENLSVGTSEDENSFSVNEATISFLLSSDSIHDDSNCFHFSIDCWSNKSLGWSANRPQHSLERAESRWMYFSFVSSHRWLS